MTFGIYFCACFWEASSLQKLANLSSHWGLFGDPVRLLLANFWAPFSECDFKLISGMLLGGAGGSWEACRNMQILQTWCSESHGLRPLPPTPDNRSLLYI